MTKQKHTKAADAASKAEELLPLEQMMSQGSASNEGAALTVEDTNQVKDGEHQGNEGEGDSLVPKLRFKTANDSSYCNWEITTLGALGYVAMCKRVFKHQTSTEIAVPFFKIGTFGEIPDAYISRELFLELRDRYPFPKMGAVLLSASGTIGRQVIYDGSDAYFQDSNIVWLEHNALVRDDFLAPFYLRTKWLGLEGSTIKRLYNKIILSQPITLPCVAEQQRIGALFKELDHNIELNRGLLDKLTQLKKSMLEQMFPSEGESVPRLRFAGFTEPWRPVYLKDVVTSFEYGLNAPAKAYDFFTKYLRITDIDEDSRKFLTTELKSPDIEAAKASNYLAKDGDLFFARTASVGRTYLYSKSDGRVVFAGYLIRGHVRQDVFCPDFVFYSTLTTHYERFVAATSARSVQPGINAMEYGFYQFAVPSLAEQQRIGEFFKTLDQRIAQQRAKIEMLGQLKKALLEQMFV